MWISHSEKGCPTKIICTYTSSIPLPFLSPLPSPLSSREKPLAFYVFTESKALFERIRRTTSSGAILQNETLVHYQGGGPLIYLSLLHSPCLLSLLSLLLLSPFSPSSFPSLTLFVQCLIPSPFASIWGRGPQWHRSVPRKALIRHFHTPQGSAVCWYRVHGVPQCQVCDPPPLIPLPFSPILQVLHPS